jgi:hypothetical protein
MPNSIDDVTLSPSVAQAIAGHEAAVELRRQLDKRAAEAAKPLALGLHFGLPVDRHHADPGLGSTAVRALAENPYNYWYQYLNPDRPDDDDDTVSRVNGRALHLLLYEGTSAFTKAFMCGPDQHGMSTSEKSATTKAANKVAAACGKECLKRDAWNRIQMSHKLITMNPDLATVFTGGMSEVTFIWEKVVDEMVVRCKARFDYLKPVTRGNSRIIAVGDLKSVANQYSMEFKRACRHAVGKYRYHAQAAHYLEAAALVPQAMDSGRTTVHGGLPPNPDYLTRLSTGQHVAWQWIFHQTTGAPLTFSYHLSPGNPVLSEGRGIADRALAAYVDNMRRFKSGEMWLMLDKPEELSIEDMGWLS